MSKNRISMTFEDVNIKSNVGVKNLEVGGWGTKSGGAYPFPPLPPPRFQHPCGKVLSYIPTC